MTTLRRLDEPTGQDGEFELGGLQLRGHGQRGAGDVINDLEESGSGAWMGSVATLIEGQVGEITK
jgi:hypothetical protein